MAGENSTGLDFFMSVYDGKYDEVVVAPRVRRSATTYACYFKGARDDLIALGIAEPDWFEDGTNHDRRGRIKRQKIFQYAGRKIKTVVNEKNKCTLVVHYNESEEILARKAEDAHLQEMHRARHEQELINEAVKEGGSQGLALKELQFSLSGVLMSFNAIDSPDIPWTSSPRVIRQANALCRELLNLLTENPVQPSLIVKARLDGKFQELIERLRA